MDIGVDISIAYIVGIASGLSIIWILKRRRKKIKEQINELEYEQKFVTKISSSSGEFVRFSHESTSFVLTLICLANFIPLSAEFIKSDENMTVSEIFTMFLWLSAAMISFKDFRRSVKSKNSKDFTEKTNKKIDKLKVKLED